MAGIGDIETGYCPLSEFQTGTPVDNNELGPGLYTAMFRLRQSRRHKQPAAKFPARVEYIDNLELDPDFCEIGYSLLDDKLEPFQEGVTWVRGGFWVATASHAIQIGRQRARIKTAYLKDDYNDSLERELDRVASGDLPLPRDDAPFIPGIPMLH